MSKRRLKKSLLQVKNARWRLSNEAKKGGITTTTYNALVDYNGKTFPVKKKFRNMCDLVISYKDLPGDIYCMLVQNPALHYMVESIKPSRISEEHQQYLVGNYKDVKPIHLNNYLEAFAEDLRSQVRNCIYSGTDGLMKILRGYHLNLYDNNQLAKVHFNRFRADLAELFFAMHVKHLRKKSVSMSLNYKIRSRTGAETLCEIDILTMSSEKIALENIYESLDKDDTVSLERIVA